MNAAAQFAHAGNLADDLAQHLGRTTRPAKPRSTGHQAANDAHYGAGVRAWTITHRLANGAAHTVCVIAHTSISAEIYALNFLPEIGAQA